MLSIWNKLLKLKNDEVCARNEPGSLTNDRPALHNLRLYLFQSSKVIKYLTREWPLTLHRAVLYSFFLTKPTLLTFLIDVVRSTPQHFILIIVIRIWAGLESDWEG